METLRKLYRAWMAFARPIGWFGSRVTLTIVYLLVFTPVAVVFRLIGRDALCRRFDLQAESYWVRRGPMPAARQYFRQF